ncbi:MAG: hypothetical protein NDI75_12805 [Candidatus Didemnitutus sp.]|nr:hypothetical protein [Candidatus Didemnitutus sp.]
MPDWVKKSLSERDICTQFITPALVRAGWDLQSQVREEVSFTKGRVIVRGKMTSRGEAQRADYVFYHASGTRYGPQARAVLKGLLAKYADSGLADLESPNVLALDPFAAMGTPVQLAKAFGGAEVYAQAVRDLEDQLYTA